MEYSGNKLTKISGVSARTLRYYDEIGLLKPRRVASSGYRIYGERELDILQQILFYRELDFPLDNIKKILYAPDFNVETAFQNHLESLLQKRDRLDRLIDNVTKSISNKKGEIRMADSEKFEGFKQSLIDKNEKKYGREIREKYGDEVVDKSNERLKGMSQKQYENGEELRLEFERTLKSAFEQNDPASETAQTACDLHRQWLMLFYPAYDKDYHKALGEMYVTDERFRANYDKLGDGCTEFLRDAINIYCE
jgi:DNA-binding transcriptional MerR regulator